MTRQLWGVSRAGLVLVVGLVSAGCGARAPVGQGNADASTAGPTSGHGATSTTSKGSPKPPTTSTSASGVTTDSGGTTDSGQDEAGFLADTYDAPPRFECSVWDQDCPSGQKCMPWANDGGNSWNATKCTPVDPMPAEPGQSCVAQGSGVSGVDDCDIGSMCWNVDPFSNFGVCAPFCAGSEGNAECDDPKATCYVSNDSALALCLPRCDPLASGCPDGQVCVPDAGAFVCLPDASEAMGVVGDPCEYNNACDPGLMCVGRAGVPGCTQSSGCCSPYCDLSDPGASGGCPGADAGESCLPVFGSDPVSAGHEHVGVCATRVDPTSYNVRLPW